MGTVLALLVALAGRAQEVGAAGLALDFNGQRIYVDSPASTRAIGTEFTVEFWVNTTVQTTQTLVAHTADSLGQDRGFALGLVQGRAVLYRPGGPGSLAPTSPAGATVADGRWHHLAATGTATNWQLFVDGELAASGPGPAGPAPWQATAPLVLGARLAGATPVELFNGVLDEVRVWNVARPPDSLRAFMCRTLPDYGSNHLPPPALVAFLALNSFTATSTPDAGSRPLPAQLHGLTNAARQISGAPLGERSRYGYAAGGQPLARLQALGLTADTVTALAFATGIQAAHLYQVGGAFGVFTVGAGSGSPGAVTFRLRYRPHAGLNCHDLLRRSACVAPWGLTGTGASADGRALDLPVTADRIEVLLTSAPPAYVYISGEAAICPGAAARFMAHAPARTRFRWNTGDTTAAIAVTAPGTYTVRTISRAGCPPQTDVWTVRLAQPVPTFSLGPDTVLCAGTSLRLAGPARADLGYAWADGALSLPTRVVSAPGNYTLTLRGDCGETRSATVRVGMRDCSQPLVVVLPPPVVPNVLTPNGDGLNDVLRLTESQAARWQLSIYNRWGGLVLNTDDYRQDWGPAAAPGLYWLHLRRPVDGYEYRGWLEVH